MNIPLNIDWQQIVLHLLNFVILAGGLYLLLYKPVKSFMDQRTEYFRTQEETARKQIQEAKEAAEQYKKRIAGVEQEIEEMKDKARAEASKEADRELKSARIEAEKIVEAARKSAELEKQRAVTKANQQIASLAADTIKMLLEESKHAKRGDESHGE